jgi:hypothetical protein
MMAIVTMLSATMTVAGPCAGQRDHIARTRARKAAGWEASPGICPFNVPPLDPDAIGKSQICHCGDRWRPLGRAQGCFHRGRPRKGQKHRMRLCRVIPNSFEG